MSLLFRGGAKGKMGALEGADHSNTNKMKEIPTFLLNQHGEFFEVVAFWYNL